MSETQTGGSSSGTSTTSVQRSSGGSSSALVTDRGKTTIADSVVAKIAGVATQEVAGVHSMGAGASRALGSLKDRFISSSESGVSRGVSVEVGERQAAIDLDIVVDYGVSIVDVAGAVRDNVVARIERMTGLEVVEVNVYVDDVHLGWDEQDSERRDKERQAQAQPERVQ